MICYCCPFVYSEVLTSCGGPDSDLQRLFPQEYVPPDSGCQDFTYQKIALQYFDSQNFAIIFMGHGLPPFCSDP